MTSAVAARVTWQEDVSEPGAENLEILRTLRKNSNGTAYHFAAYWKALFKVLKGTAWLDQVAADCERDEVQGFYAAILRSYLADELFRAERLGESIEACVATLAVLAEATDLPNAASADALKAKVHRIRGRIELKLGRVDMAFRELQRGEQFVARALEAVPGDEDGVSVRNNLRRLRLEALSSSGRIDELVSLAKAWLVDAEGVERVKLRGRMGVAGVRMIRRGEPIDIDVEPLLLANLNDRNAAPDDLFMANLSLGRLLSFRKEYSEARQYLDKALGLATASVDRARAAAEIVALKRASGDHAPGELEEIGSVFDRHFDGLVEFLNAAPLDTVGSGGLLYTGRQQSLRSAIDLEFMRGGDPASALTPVLAVQGTSTLARSLGAQGTSLRSFQSNCLGAGEVCLVYAVGALRGHVFLVESDHVSHVEVTGVHTWSHLIEELADELLRSPLGLSDAELLDRDRIFTGHGEALAEHLIPVPFRSAVLGADSLSVVGIDFLGWVPFELLRLGEAPLGLTHAVTYAPSLPVQEFLSARRRSRPASQTGALVVIAPHQAQSVGLPQLAMDARWSEDAGNAWQGLNLLTGSQASFTSVVDRVGDDVELLQLLVHGFRGRGPGRSAGLVLAPTAHMDNGVAYAHDWGSFSVPSIVLATACGSWRGAQRVGDGGAGELASAMFLGGADCVAVTAADVSYSATLELSREFLRAAEPGVSPAEALRRARIVLASGDEYRDPYFHSLIHFLGAALEPLTGGTPASQRGMSGSPASGSIIRIIGAVSMVVLVVLALGLIRRLNPPRQN